MERIRRSTVLKTKSAGEIKRPGCQQKTTMVSECRHSIWKHPSLHKGFTTKIRKYTIDFTRPALRQHSLEKRPQHEYDNMVN